MKKRTAKKTGVNERGSGKHPAGQTTGLPDASQLMQHTGDEDPQIRILSKARILPYLAGLLLIAAGYLVFIVYRSYAWPLFIAMLFYVGFDGVNRRLLPLLGRSPSAAAGVSTLFVLVTVLGPIALLVRHLIQEVVALGRTLQAYMSGDRLIETLVSFPRLTDQFTENPFFWTTLPETYRSYLADYAAMLESPKFGDWLSNAYSVVTGGLSLTAGLAVNLLFGLIILFFLFRDGPQFYSFLEEALPFPKTITESFARRMRHLIRAVLLGNIFVSILQGAAVGVGLTICGIQNSVVYGVIAGIFSLIPIVGTAVVWLPAVLYLVLAEGSYGFALFLAIWCVLFYLFLENILKPKILDRRLGVHPLFLFFAILGGLAEFGPTGVIVGPLIVTLFMTIWSIYHIWGGAESGTVTHWAGSRRHAAALEPTVPLNPEPEPPPAERTPRTRRAPNRASERPEQPGTAGRRRPDSPPRGGAARKRRGSRQGQAET